MTGAKGWKTDRWFHRLLPLRRRALGTNAVGTAALRTQGRAPAELPEPPAPASAIVDQAEQRIAHFVLPDDLAQLSSRAVVLERLEQSIDRARQSAGGLAVLYLDVDRPKPAGNAHGHAVGDPLLAEVARRMQASMRDGDTVGRMGGHEFAVVFPGVASVEQAARSAQRLAATIREPYVLNGEISRIDVSIGIALFPADGATAEELLRRADSALHRAKYPVRGVRPSAEPAPAPEETRLLEQDLGLAFDLDQFELTYQPIFDTKTSTPLAFEAQVRWRHPTRGVVPAAVFMPLCEQAGLIQKLGRWVMHTACTEAATWATPARLAVNLSHAQFGRDDLEHLVIETLQASSLAPGRLDIEVTAAALHEHSQQMLAAMLSLRPLGVRLVVDDFGQPNASLNSLRDFAFQQIKIGPSFVAAMLTDPGAMATVLRAIDMAADQELDLVAEGVETQAQLDTLTRLGCAQVQGALLGAPQSPERTRKYLWDATRRTEGVPLLLAAE